MFWAVSFDGKEEFGVLDDISGVIDKVNYRDIKSYLKQGVEIYGIVLKEDINPIYTFHGLNVNLAYQKVNRVGRYKVVLLNKGDYFGRSLHTEIREPTVAFYDTAVEWSLMEYPLGQYVTSYKAQTLLQHKGGLRLDASVPEWIVEPYEIDDIKRWLSYQLGLTK